MLKYPCSVPLLFCMMMASADIYKWKDEKGDIHYSDCPPGQKCKIQKEYRVPLTGNGTPAPIQGTDNDSEYRKPDPAPAPMAAQQSVHRPFYIEAGETDCFSPADTILDVRIAAADVPVQIRTLDKTEQRQIGQLIKRLGGRWHGVNNQFVCTERENETYAEHRQFNVRYQASKDRFGTLQMEIDLHSNDLALRRDKDFWMLLNGDRFRFGDMKTIQPDAPQWDVGIVSIADDELVFVRKFRRSGIAGTSQRYLELRSFYLQHNRLYIHEWFYVQDLLVEYDSWVLNKL